MAQKLRAKFDTGDVERLSGELELDDVVDAGTINGVAVNNTPSGAGESLVTVDAANAQWATPAASGIPQGGPLTAILDTDGHAIQGPTLAGGGQPGAMVAGNPISTQGGVANLFAGQSPSGLKVGGSVQLDGATDAADGVAHVTTGGKVGAAGEALVSDGAAGVQWAGVQIAAGVPAGAPTGLPLAFDSTAVTGGLYVWNGAAWVKVSTIP